MRTKYLRWQLPLSRTIVFLVAILLTLSLATPSKKHGTYSSWIEKGCMRMFPFLYSTVGATLKGTSTIELRWWGQRRTEASWDDTCKTLLHDQDHDHDHCFASSLFCPRCALWKRGREREDYLRKTNDGMRGFFVFVSTVLLQPSSSGKEANYNNNIPLIRSSRRTCVPVPTINLSSYLE